MFITVVLFFKTYLGHYPAFKWSKALNKLLETVKVPFWINFVPNLKWSTFLQLFITIVPVLFHLQHTLRAHVHFLVYFIGCRDLGLIEFAYDSGRYSRNRLLLGISRRCKCIILTDLKFTKFKTFYCCIIILMLCWWILSYFL